MLSGNTILSILMNVNILSNKILWSRPRTTHGSIINFLYYCSFHNLRTLINFKKKNWKKGRRLFLSKERLEDFDLAVKTFFLSKEWLEDFDCLGSWQRTHIHTHIYIRNIFVFSFQLKTLEEKKKWFERKFRPSTKYTFI